MHNPAPSDAFVIAVVFVVSSSATNWCIFVCVCVRVSLFCLCVCVFLCKLYICVCLGKAVHLSYGKFACYWVILSLVRLFCSALYVRGCLGRYLFYTDVYSLCHHFFVCECVCVFVTETESVLGWRSLGLVSR